MLVGLISVLALAACGESAEDKYKDDFPPVNRELVSLGNEVGESIQSAERSSDEQLADDFGNYAKRLGGIQQDLDELEPPDDLAEDQDQLVSAIGDVQGALDDIAGAAEQGDPGAARDATVQLIRGSQELRDARETLARAVREL
jgi:methionyl-tRNA synthetase